MMTNPYAEYIRILGRGPIKSRHLTLEEARFAFGGVLSGDMLDMQVGALLLLLRYRSESPAELAGIVSAIRDHIGLNNKMSTNQKIIDWPSYSSGKSRRLPWFLLSAKLLAENGLKIFMHGFNSHLENGLPTEACLTAIGETPASSIAEARKTLCARNFSYLPLRNYCPKLQELLEIRSVLGVRSVVNTAVKLVNPLGAELIFLGIFHPAYITLNLEAALLLGQSNLGVIKGGGGEAERNILKPIKLFQLSEAQVRTSDWSKPDNTKPDNTKPDINNSSHMKARGHAVSVDYLADIWQGRLQDDYASAMIMGTAAQALYLTGQAGHVDEAENLAKEYWFNHLNM